MNKPWSCGSIFAGIILVIIVLMAVGAIDLGRSETTNTIAAAKRACEGQTGQPCL